MIKRGFIGGWSNRRWQQSKTALQGGSENPNVPPGGTGSIPDYVTNEYRGSGTHYQWIDDELVTWLGEVAFLSPVMQYTDGRYYRFIIQYIKASRTSNACAVVFGMRWTDSEGRLQAEAGSQWTNWENAVIDRNGQILATRFFYAESKYTWDVVTTMHPQFTVDFYNMMNGNANTFVKESLEKIKPLSHRTTMILWNEGAWTWSKEPLTFESGGAGGNEIVQRALSLRGYKYWYGGDGRVATKQYADSLRASYPSIWTAKYYSIALADIGSNVADCSYLCNYAYGKASPGNHGAGTSSYPGLYSRWTGQPRDGMICWRPGHCGIYNQGTTIEMSSQATDFVIRPYNAGKWQATYYDKNRQY